MRFERRFAPRTRLLVATEGILTARLQSDPLLSGFRTVVLDEFHERSLHADLALALARQAWRARDDLRLLVMSATLDAGPVARFLDGCPVIEVAGPAAPGRGRATSPALSRARGGRAQRARGRRRPRAVLPARERPRSAARRRSSAPRAADAPCCRCTAACRPRSRTAPWRPSARRKRRARDERGRDLADASTGVSDVIDSGLQKVLRYDAERGLDRLEPGADPGGLGRAARRPRRANRARPRAAAVGPARSAARRGASRRSSASTWPRPVLEVLAWGGDPAPFEWFEAPPAERLEAAVRPARAARRGGGTAADAARRGAARAAAAPAARARVARGRRRTRRAAARLRRRWPRAGGRAADEPATTDSDVLAALDRWRDAPPGVQAAAARAASGWRAARGTA